MRTSTLIAIAAATTSLCLFGCSRDSSSPARVRRSAPIDPWRLVCFDPTDSIPAFLTNGLVGIRIGRDGTGYDVQGIALPAYEIDVYRLSGEEKIQRVPNPLQVAWTIGGQGLDPKRSNDYEQTLEMRTGLLTTSWSQPNVSIRNETLVDPLDRSVYQRWTVTVRTSCDCIVKSGLTSSARTTGDPGGTFAFDWGQTGVTATMEHAFTGLTLDGRSTRPRISGTAVVWHGTANPGVPISLDRRVRFQVGSARRSLIEAPIRATGAIPQTVHVAEERVTSTRVDFDSELKRCRAVWAKRWETDIEIDGPKEDQRAIHSFLFYLRSGTNAQSLMSISPFGLSSNRYGGHVFWDADTWVFPVLALIDPDAARAIPLYRIRRLAVAQRAHSASAPFPWESSATGNEVAPPEFAKELHISGDVARAVDQAADFGLVNREDANRAIVAAARFWLSRMKSTSGGEWSIEDVMSPDESHVGNNDLYTNLIAQWTIDRARQIDPTMPKRTLVLPRDATSFLSYDNDALRGYKQPAAILSLYPLQYPPAESEAIELMNRFSQLATKNGPAMTDSLNALIWARLMQPDVGYAAWLRSWQDYVRSPLLLFSERRNGGETYFLTGAAMCAQSVVYGFLGFRLESVSGRSVAWSINLHGDRRLTIQPNLPSAWQRVTFKNFHILDHRYTFEATHSSCKLTRSDEDSGANP